MSNAVAHKRAAVYVANRLGLHGFAACKTPGKLCRPPQEVWSLEGSCLQLLVGAVVDGPFGLTAEGVASNAPPDGPSKRFALFSVHIIRSLRLFRPNMDVSDAE